MARCVGRANGVAPAVGFEPTTWRLTAARSTTELRRSEGPSGTVGDGPGATPRDRIAWGEMSLIAPLDLAARLGDQDLRVVDVRWYLGEPGRGRRAYDAGHLPGAIFLDMDTDLAATSGPGRHPLPQPALLAERLGRAGIGSDDFIVACDDVTGWVAARLWWMLDDLGHARVALLDGGFPAWIAAGLPVTTEIASLPPARLSLADHWTRVVDRDQLLGRLGEVVVLDARAPARYRGEIEPIDPVAGHIPTARNAPTADNLGPDGRFLPPDALAARFRSLGVGVAEGARVSTDGDGVGRVGGAGGVGGVDGVGAAAVDGAAVGDGAAAGDGAAETDVVTSCGSGVSACHNALAIRLAGLPSPLLYPGSWSDWSTAGFPVAMGPDPGEAPRD